VQVLQGQDQLGNVKFGAFFSKSSLALQVPEQFTATLKICHQVEIGVRLETKFEADEEW
jgi:hypothetical protein